MSEPSTLSFTLTYVATLGVALLMFVAQVIAVSALLALAGIGVAFTTALQAVSRIVHTAPNRPVP